MSLAEAPMTTRQALVASERITPNVLEATIAKQREQLADQLRIADGARKLAEESADDCETWAVAARRVADLRKALDENVEMQMQSRATVPEASSPSLGNELWKRITIEGDAEARKIVLDMAKKLSKKEPARGAR